MQRRIALGKLTTTRSNYYGARYYNPRISLFLGVDPLAEQTMQPYAYANNNPVRFIDLTGMASEEAGDPPKKGFFGRIVDGIKTSLEVRIGIEFKR